MKNPIAVPCGFCEAWVDRPCLSVNGHPKATPHMQRLRAADLTVADWMRAQALYLDAVLVHLFGRTDAALRARAYKAGSINMTKPWAKKLLTEGAAQEASGQEPLEL